MADRMRSAVIIGVVLNSVLNQTAADGGAATQLKSSVAQASISAVKQAECVWYKLKAT